MPDTVSEGFWYRGVERTSHDQTTPAVSLQLEPAFRRLEAQPILYLDDLEPYLISAIQSSAPFAHARAV
jgi:hypothetical protein